MMLTKIKKTELESKLTFHIDHYWNAVEFATLFDSMNRLYEFNRLLETTLAFYYTQHQELEFSEKINSLPTFVNIRNNFVQESFRIFKDDIRLLDYNNPIVNFNRFGSSPLQVTKLQFASRGSVDFVGVGKIFEIIKDTIIHYFPNKDKKIDMILKLKEIEERDQKILQIKIDNLKKLGLSEKEILSIIGMESFQLNNILSLKDKGIIIDVEVNNIDN